MSELDNVLKKISKLYGKDALFTLETKKPEKIKVIPTGSLQIDEITGIGGFPEGRFIEIFGKESSGKTTIALHAIAEAQKMGYSCAFIDAEHALDLEYAARVGVDIQKMFISLPDTGEEALGIAEELVRSGEIKVLVIDSVAALVPKKEIEGEMGDAHVGLHARLMAQALRKLAGVTSKTGTVVILINQIRSNIGGFGDPETTSGGRALKYFASMRIKSDLRGLIKEGETVVGRVAKIKMVKNKLALPFKSCEVEMYGSGISVGADVLNAAEKAGLITTEGNSPVFNGVKLGRGHGSAVKAVSEDLELREKIINAVRETYGKNI